MAGNPWLQSAVLFLGPFVLEEAALLAGAVLAAAEALPPLVALAALYAGMVVSDWLLYGLGYLAGSHPRLRRFVRDENIVHGRAFLERSLLYASISARLVPWLLLPIFVSCGFLRVSVLRFMAINAVIALIYTTAIFWALYAFDLLIFELLDVWGWAVIGVLALAIIWGSQRIAKRAQVKPPGLTKE